MSTPVVTTLITGAAALASIASALAAWRNANKSNKSAVAATDALAHAIRPAFAFDLENASFGPQERVIVAIRNVSLFTAANIRLEIANTTDGTTVHSSTVGSLAGVTRSGVDPQDQGSTRIDFDLPAISVNGKPKQSFDVHVKYYDYRNAQRWMQSAHLERILEQTTPEGSYLFSYGNPRTHEPLQIDPES